VAIWLFGNAGNTGGHAGRIAAGEACSPGPVRMANTLAATSFERT
jgi:hypothetical protein